MLLDHLVLIGLLVVEEEKDILLPAQVVDLVDLMLVEEMVFETAGSKVLMVLFRNTGSGGGGAGRQLNGGGGGSGIVLIAYPT